MSPDVRARVRDRGVRLRAFHRTHEALLMAAFTDDETGVARCRERLANLASALEDDDHVQYLYRQALEIVEAPNSLEYACLHVWESLQLLDLMYQFVMEA